MSDLFECGVTTFVIVKVVSLREVLALSSWLRVEAGGDSDIGLVANSNAILDSKGD